jgi:TPR repeat protein
MGLPMNMPSLRRLAARAFTAFLLTSVSTLAVHAEATTDDEKAAAVKACDLGATSPLDPDGKAPPKHLSDMNPTFDTSVTEKLITACRDAALAYPDEQRFAIQLARAMYLDFKSADVVLPTLQRFADNGHVEAQFMLYRSRASKLDPMRNPAEANKMMNYLRNAAEAGHALAIAEMRNLRRFGGLLKRDNMEAIRWADRWANLPSQGPGGEWEHQKEFEDVGKLYAAAMRIFFKDVSPEEKRKAFATIKEMYDAGNSMAVDVYGIALRDGSGVEKQPEAARAVFERGIAAGNSSAAVELARMLISGEGGPRDARHAIDLLYTKSMHYGPQRADVVTRLFLSNELVGRDPRRVIQAMQDTPGTIEDYITLAGLLEDYQAKVNKTGLIDKLSLAAAVGEPGAAMALARLKLSPNPDFRDEAGARELFALLARDGDKDARLMLASAHFSNLDSTSQTRLASGPMGEADIRNAISEGVAANNPRALLLQGQLTRKGVLFPQDDEAATRLIVKAAELGSVDAMIMAGKAYDDGLGVQKNPRERLRFWREAARRGSVQAQENLASAFTFDFGARVMNLQEGISVPIALYGNGAGRRYGDQTNIMGMQPAIMAMSGMFTGGRISDFPRKAVAAAVMDGFRMAPAGLSEEKLVPLGKTLPQDIRAEIEKILKTEASFAGDPQGYFGPDARAALRNWVDAKGPFRDTPQQQVAAVTPQAAPSPAAFSATSALPAATISAVREKAFALVPAAKSDAQRTAAIRQINALARYGDQPARWVIMRNYHQSTLLRAAVTPAELTRYNLDILVSKLAETPKADFEFIFNLTEMYKKDRSKAFAGAFIGAVRDDPRLQDLSTLTEIAKHMQFSPGACDGVAAAARELKVAVSGDDGCAEGSLDALIAYAKKAGPANIESKAREAGAAEVAKLAQ